MTLRVGRRVAALAGVATGLAWALRAGRAHAEDAPVPAALQVKLLVKVAGYDKNLPARAGEKVKVLVVLKEGNDDAKRIAAQVVAALGEEKEIAGKPIETSSSSFSDAVALKKAVASRKLAIVYLTPGFGSSDVEAIAKELSGIDVLSAAAVPTTVPKGIVLGFDLVSSKPKILVNLTQAKKQNVALAAEVLKLAKVYE
jgi:hypothetical protein